MPNKRSAKKRMRQNLKRRERNRSAKSAMKSAVKAASVAPTDVEKTREAMRIIGKTAKRGIIHPNKAARLASRLQRRVNAAGKAAAPAA
jgi:small subunit ribosomal protein S20